MNGMISSYKVHKIFAKRESSLSDFIRPCSKEKFANPINTFLPSWRMQLRVI